MSYERIALSPATRRASRGKDISRRGALSYVTASLLSVLLCHQATAQSSPSAAVGPIPPPVAAHSDAGELACKTYGTSASPPFISDDSVVSQFVPSRSSKERKTLPPPCTEVVSANVIPKGQGTAPPASQGSLNSLFAATRTPLQRLQNGFDLYSWLTFIALNSPDDSQAPFGLSDAPTVWEKRFFPLDQVIRSSEDPSVVNKNLINLPKLCPMPRPGAPTPSLFVTVDDVAFDQPFKTGPLVDQDGHYTLNTIFMNSTMKDYIVSNHLYSAQGQAVFPPRIDFPPGHAAAAQGTAGVLGSIMIKASWKVLTHKDDPHDFLTVIAYLWVPPRPGSRRATEEKCDIATLGLVGLHIVHKTVGRRQWIWTTFEHVRNAPSSTEVATGHFIQRAYLFFDERRSIDGDDAVNMTPPQPWDPLKPQEEKSQIVRAEDITPDTKTINRHAHAYLKSLAGHGGFAASDVWEHYELVSTQWPADFRCAAEQDQGGKGTVQANQQPDPTCAPAPEFLPNSTLETYVQHDIGTSGGVPQATSSCIGCHNNAVAYQNIDYGRANSRSSGTPSAAKLDCASDAPDRACSPASDFTYILEQACAPVIDPITRKPNFKVCKHD